MTTTEKRLNVMVTAYEGDVAFPEAEHYPEFVADRLAETFGASVETSTGLSVQVFAYGFGDDETTVIDDAKRLVRNELWEEFCDHGYKDFSEPAGAQAKPEAIATSAAT